jgi:ubiquinone/menaquinone biosynthesis C-methylase UbiE
VFKEIYRVLKPGAELHIWDMVIPERFLPEKDIYLLAMEITLQDQKVNTGYGAFWKDKVQNAGYFDALAAAVGFEKVESLEKDKLIRLIYKK